MGFIKLNCPSCGANIDFDNSKEFGFCQYCGTKIVQDKVVVEHKGSVSLDRSSETKNLLIRAQEMLDKGLYQEAENYYNRVLDIDTNNSTARQGIDLCYKLIHEPNVTLTRIKSNIYNNKAKMEVYINGNLKGTLLPEQKLSFIMPVGTHEITIKIKEAAAPTKPYSITIKNRLERHNLVLRAKALGVTEITDKGDGKTYCKQCGKEISDIAEVCPHCGCGVNSTTKTAKKKSTKKKPGCLIAIGIVLALFLLIGIFAPSEPETDGETTTTTTSQNKQTTTTEKVNKPGISIEEFNAIKAGMSYKQVVEIIGSEGELLSESDIGMGVEYVTKIYSWDSETNYLANATFTFQGGKLVSKSQIGLD